MNLYAYVANDPLNRSDPTGREGVGSWNNGQCNFDGCRPPAPAQPITANDVATAVEVAGVVVDVATALTPSGPVPEATAAGRGLGGLIRRIFGKTCCFVAGTLVETRDGLRPIEEIGVGDLVLSRDEATGETAYKPVTDLIRRHERVIWEVALTGPGASHARFETTDDHPWWIAGMGWKRTEELAPGMAVVTADGRGMVVASVTETERTANTYNLTVADFETYFVGEPRILVHNCPDGRTASDPLRTENGRQVPDPEARGAAHTQLGTRTDSDGRTYNQRREFDAEGRPVNDADFTDHGRSDHPNPHRHDRTEVSGSYQRGPTRPLREDER